MRPDPNCFPIFAVLPDVKFRHGIPDPETRTAIWADRGLDWNGEDIAQLDKWLPGKDLVSVYYWPVNEREKAAIKFDELGWKYFNRGEYLCAKDQLDKAVFFDSTNPSIRYHRGMVHLKLCGIEEALQDFKRACSTRAPFPEYNLNQEMIRKLS